MLRPKKQSLKPKLKHRPFLKWAGGKFRLTDDINKAFPNKRNCLIEPFVGAGAVFLNSNFERYILADINPDLINLFNIVKENVEGYIEACKPIFFADDANTPDYYYDKRRQFNASTDPFERSIIFLYLNRFGFNGLCRYNSKNEFNVPFGAYKTHYFPEEELRYFAHKAQSAVFLCCDFQKTFEFADKDSVIYCEPPYAPLQQDTNFTGYAGNEFGLAQQRALADLAKSIQKEKQIPILISNHDTKFTREIYNGAKFKRVTVQRSISQNSEKRIKVKELIAIFGARK